MVTGPGFELVDVTKSLQVQQEALAALLEELQELLIEAFNPRTAFGSTVGAPLVTALDLGGSKGRITLEIWVSSSAAATFLVESSRNGVDWRSIDTILIGPAGGTAHRGYINAYPMVRVRTLAANNNIIEMVASR